MSRKNIKSTIKNRLKNIENNHIQQRFEIFLKLLNHHITQIKRCYIVSRYMLFLNEQSFRKNESNL